MAKRKLQPAPAEPAATFQAPADGGLSIDRLACFSVRVLASRRHNHHYRSRDVAAFLPDNLPKINDFTRCPKNRIGKP